MTLMLKVFPHKKYVDWYTFKLHKCRSFSMKVDTNFAIYFYFIRMKFFIVFAETVITSMMALNPNTSLLIKLLISDERFI